MRLRGLPRRDWRKVAAYNQTTNQRSARQAQRLQPSGHATAGRAAAQGRQVQQEARTTDPLRLRTQEHDHTQIPTAPQQAMAGAADETSHC